MATLSINPHELVDDLERNIEGQLGWFRDGEGREICVEYGEDPDEEIGVFFALLQLLRKQTTFPATIELSDAEALHALFRVEDMRDEVVYPGDAKVSDVEAALEHLKAQCAPLLEERRRRLRRIQ